MPRCFSLLQALPGRRRSSKKCSHESYARRLRGKTDVPPIQLPSAADAKRGGTVWVTVPGQIDAQSVQRSILSLTAHTLDRQNVPTAASNIEHSLESALYTRANSHSIMRSSRMPRLRKRPTCKLRRQHSRRGALEPNKHLFKLDLPLSRQAPPLQQALPPQASTQTCIIETSPMRLANAAVNHPRQRSQHPQEVLWKRSMPCKVSGRESIR